MKRLTAFTLALLLALCCCATAEVSSPFAARTANDSYSFYVVSIPGIVVNCNSYVTLRSYPSKDSRALMQVYLGEDVLVTSRRVYEDGGDYFVEVEAGGETGFILITYIDTLIPDYANRRSDTYGIGYGTVTANDPGDDLILRSGPGTQYSALGYLFGGEVLDSLGYGVADNNGRLWYCCQLDGAECWVSSKYTRLRTPN